MVPSSSEPSPRFVRRAAPGYLCWCASPFVLVFSPQSMVAAKSFSAVKNEARIVDYMSMLAAEMSMRESYPCPSPIQAHERSMPHLPGLWNGM